MNIVFRADASIQIGTGHVMRCLALATELQQRGHTCRFICRDHPGHLAELIVSKDFKVDLLPPVNHTSESNDLNWNPHATWLGVHWQLDAEQTQSLLESQPADWLVVDHYALDNRWEQPLSGSTARIMVIDDLADREHQCDLLLDQTFGRDATDYRRLVPDHCQLLCGSEYALLRPEFAELRSYSLQRRRQPALRQMLINMGGVDKDNVTGQVLEALHDSPLPADCRVVVVMGATAPWLDTINKQAKTLPWQTEVLVGVSNMAELMANSDLAIGAAGATSWERCCLGLPTIMVVLADNQQTIASMLKQAGAAAVPPSLNSLNPQLLKLLTEPQSLQKMSTQAAQISEGRGSAKVCTFLEGPYAT